MTLKLVMEHWDNFYSNDDLDLFKARSNLVSYVFTWG